MELTLIIDGKEKHFVSDDPTVGLLRDLLELQKGGINFGLFNDPVHMDKVSQKICDLFGNKFTLDQFYAGLPSKKFMEIVNIFTDEVFGTLPEAEDESAKK